MNKRTTKRRLLLGALALITMSTAGPALALPPHPESYSECFRRSMIDGNLWVFGAAGTLVAIGTCRITSR